MYSYPEMKKIFWVEHIKSSQFISWHFHSGREDTLDKALVSSTTLRMPGPKTLIAVLPINALTSKMSQVIQDTYL